MAEICLLRVKGNAHHIGQSPNSQRIDDELMKNAIMKKSFLMIIQWVRLVAWAHFKTSKYLEECWRVGIWERQEVLNQE